MIEGVNSTSDIVMTVDKDKDQGSNNSQRSVLSLDKAAFLLIRIKKAFKKRKKESHLTEKSSKKKNPLLRAKTLPAIITPSLNIIQGQIDATVGAKHANYSSNLVSQLKVSPVSKSRTKGSPGVSSKKGTPPGVEKWQLLVDDDVSYCRSSGNSPRNSFSSTGSSTSQTSAHKDKYDTIGSHTKASLANLARLLNPRDKSSADKPPRHGSDNSLAPDSASMRKANSIDSLLESSNATISLGMVASPASSPCSQNGKALPSSPSVPAKLESHKRCTAPNSPPTMPSKMAKSIPGIRGGCVERLETGITSKAERKRLEKVYKFNIDLQALFSSIEHGQVDRARSILDTTDVEVNSVNGDGFTPLDLAVMTTNVTMVKLLQAHGASESSKFPHKDTRSQHLQGLMREAGRCVEDLGTCVLAASTNGSLSAALLKEKERQLSLWKRRHNLLKRMKDGFDRIRPPDPPSSVLLEVLGTRSLNVRFTEPDSAHEAESIVTKYKVEWSCYEDFSPLSGSRVLSDVQKCEVTIPDLTHGTTYFVRVAAGNVKGYSIWQNASPLSATPSCWRDVDDNKGRLSPNVDKLDDLFHQIMATSSPHVRESKDLSDTPQQQRRQVRKSIKQLFTSAPKFHKTMKRGVYLASLLYNDQKVAVTAEDTLPILEVDETYPSHLHTDFYWLMKIACTWEDVKTVRQDMEKSPSSSNLHFRSKLLQAVEQMQSALGIQDLGQLYAHPLKDSDGTTVLCTVKRIKDPKAMVTLSVRWLPLYKLRRKRLNTSENGLCPTANDMLLDSLHDVITYDKVSRSTLSRGLYIGYVKLKSSVDVIKVLVPKSLPNVLPHCKVRENPHVSCDEWQWFKDSLHGKCNSDGATEIQTKFQKVVSAATNRLLNDLKITETDADTHRFYDAEVIELSKDVSFLLILPAVDNVCSVPGQYEDIVSHFDCTYLPVQIFEMINMSTYKPSFICRYSRMSSILEVGNIVANHAQREAFSTTEVNQAKTRISQLQDLQSQVDNTWRTARWVMDVLTFARDKQITGGIPLNFFCLGRSSPTTPGTPPRCPDLHLPKVPPPEIPYETLTPQMNGSWKREIRRCSSTSMLNNVTASTDLSTDDAEVETQQKTCSAEKLTDKNPSVRSSRTGSLSSLDVTLEEDRTSVYSKDSACSVSGDSRRLELDFPLEPAPSEVIRVYAAYETGLPSGTSVKLHITPLTTAREIVDLVVKQLNMAVVLKGRGGPVYGCSHLQNFCLVSIIGSRERFLRDDFQPMKLQNPWIKGKLCVRKKNCPYPASID